MEISSSSLPSKRETAGQLFEEWAFPEYEQHERSRGWFIGAAVLGAALVVWSVVTANFLFAFIIIMVAVIIVSHHYNQPTTVTIRITSKGISLDDHIYPFDQIDKFWLIYDPPQVKKLYFQFKNKFHPRLMVPLHDKNPLHIRSLLLEYLEEDLSQEQEPVTEALARRWKL